MFLAVCYARKVRKSIVCRVYDQVKGTKKAVADKACDQLRVSVGGLAEGRKSGATQ